MNRLGDDEIAADGPEVVVIKGAVCRWTLIHAAERKILRGGVRIYSSLASSGFGAARPANRYSLGWAAPLSTHQQALPRALAVQLVKRFMVGCRTGSSSK